MLVQAVAQVGKSNTAFVGPGGLTRTVRTKQFDSLATRWRLLGGRRPSSSAAPRLTYLVRGFMLSPGAVSASDERADSTAPARTAASSRTPETSKPNGLKLPQKVCIVRKTHGRD